MQFRKSVSMLSVLFIVVSSLPIIPTHASPIYTTDIVPIKTSDTAPTPYVSSASSVWAGNSSFYAFDDNPSTYWYPSDVSNDWITMDFGLERMVTQYTIKTTSQTNYTPHTWVFQGSQNNTAWTTLDSQSSPISWSVDEMKTFPVANSSTYRYYRLMFTSYNGPGLMISEIQMLTDFDSSAPDEVSAVSAVRYDDRIKLSWTNPTDIDFAATNIYRNGLFIASVRDFSGSYLDAGL